MIASLKASADNPRLSSDNILYMLINTGLRDVGIFLRRDGILLREDGMLPREDGIALKEDGIFKRSSFFLFIRAAEENVAGIAKLTDINNKHLAIRGAFFLRNILHDGSGCKCPH